MLHTARIWTIFEKPHASDSVKKLGSDYVTYQRFSDQREREVVGAGKREDAIALERERRLMLEPIVWGRGGGGRGEGAHIIVRISKL